MDSIPWWPRIGIHLLVIWLPWRYFHIFNFIYLHIVIFQYLLMNCQNINSVLSYYGGDVVSMLISILPDIGLDKHKLASAYGMSEARVGGEA